MIAFLRFKDDFTKNFLTLLSGSVIAQILSLIGAWAITWLYLPEDMAVAEMYLRIVMLLAVMSTVRYEMAIMLPKQEVDSLSILRLCFYITIGVTIITFVAITIGGPTFITLINLPGLSDYLFLIPLSVFIGGIYQGINYWQIRNKFYRNISVASVSSSIFNNGTKVAIGAFANLGPLGLIVSSILGQFIAVFVFLKKSYKGIFSTEVAGLSSRVKANATQYKNFPLVNMPHALTDSVRDLVIITLILYYFGGVTMGIYALVVRLLKWPMGLVGTSMSQVFFQEAAEKFANKEDIVPLITRTLWPLIKLGLPLLLIFMFVAEDLINLVFSEKWSAAGEYAQILAPWLFLNFLISPISQIPNIVNKQKQVFLLSLFGFSAALGSLVLGSFLFDEVLQTFMLFSAVQSVYLFFVILWIRFIAIKAQTDRA